MSPPSVLLAGGGTAGHIEPALATADALRRLRPDVRVTLLGTARGLETRLVPARGYPLELVPPVPLPRRLTPDLVRVPGRLVSAVRRAGQVLEGVGGEVVVGFGGYVALPAYLAARRRRIPVVVHEANARPGLANRIGARGAAVVAAASPGVRLRGAVYVGMPLRTAVATLDRSAARAAAAAELGLDPAVPTLLVTGGSQGARRLNLAVGAAAHRLVQAGLQVLHVTGQAHLDAVRAQAAGAATDPRYRTVAYLDRMELGYAVADLALCRAGAMTCAELTAVGLPAVFVPLPIGNGEQRLNAAAVVDAGGGIMVDDADLDAALVLTQVPPLLTDPGRLAAMSAAARRLGRRDADDVLARMVLSVVERSA